MLYSYDLQIMHNLHMTFENKDCTYIVATPEFRLCQRKQICRAGVSDTLNKDRT